MKKGVIQSILSYSGCRSFLKDFFSEQKNINSKYSLRYFAQITEFSSHSHLSSIINGNRKLTDEAVKKLLKVLPLTGYHLTYFLLLVDFENAVDIKAKESVYSKMQSLLLKHNAGNLASYQYHYFDEWYYPVLREVAVFADWNGDYGTLAKLIIPSITANQAKKGVETLVQMKLLKEVNGKHSFSDTTLYTTGLPQFVFQKARTNAIKSAIIAGEILGPQERTIYCSTLEVSETKKEKLEKLVASFINQYELLLHEKDNDEITQILQYNIQLFPLTKKFSKE